jgi:hypothetical protein
MKGVFILTVLVVFSALAFPAIIYVPDDYKSIQDAINASVDGDAIIVRPGTYIENIDFRGKAVTVTSEAGPAVTIIDGNKSGSVAVFQNGEGMDSVLEGFTLSNGSGQYNAAMGQLGGGVYCHTSSPIIRNNVITGGFVDAGGGIYCFDSSAVIIGNDISVNEYLGEGGGGIFCDSASPTIINNVISGNSVGGADLNSRGGGICLENSAPMIVSNTFHRNDTGSSFMGIPGDGGAIYCGGNSSPAVVNSILWDNFPDEIYILSGSPVVTYSNVMGGWTGTGNIDGDPLFVDAAGGDYHLTLASPCRDSGDNSSVTYPDDFEGDPRIAGGAVDMGADEIYYHLYHLGSVFPGSTFDLRVVGHPQAPVTLALGTGVVDPPLSTQHGDLWLQLPLMWSGSIGVIPADGVLFMKATTPLIWSPGQKRPLQALVGPWGGAMTRLTNLEMLFVE